MNRSVFYLLLHIFTVVNLVLLYWLLNEYFELSCFAGAIWSFYWWQFSSIFECVNFNCKYSFFCIASTTFYTKINKKDMHELTIYNFLLKMSQPKNIRWELSLLNCSWHYWSVSIGESSGLHEQAYFYLQYLK